MPTYNVVSEGVDPTGETAIDPVLGGLVGSDTTVVFPAGTYTLDSLIVPSDVDGLRLVAPEGARLVPAVSRDGKRWIDVRGDEFVLDGFELDVRDVAVPPYVRMRTNAADWELRRLVTRGNVRAATDTGVGSGDSGDARSYFVLSSADGSRGLLQDCYFHEGSCAQTEASNRRAVLVETSKGDIVFNRCWFESWGENTMYAKKPAGQVRLYNCYFRNTNNGIRVGGNTELRNCVSIKNAQHPRAAWSNGSIQRGVVSEATTPTDESTGINSYDGTLLIEDCDFRHRYEDNSCRPPIAAPKPCRRIDVRDTRVSYNTSRSADAVYTERGEMIDGTPANLEYLRLQRVHVRNDSERAHAISIGQAPDEWGPVSGVLGGSGSQTDSTYVRSRMTTNGDPDGPDTTPPLPTPPSLGSIPLQNAQLVRVDNAGTDSESTYEIAAGDHVLPAGNEGAAVTIRWGPDDGPRRPPNTSRATGTLSPGDVHAFYVTGGLVETSATGPATWTVDSNPYAPNSGETGIVSENQTDTDWHSVALSKPRSNPVVLMKPLSYNGSDPTHVRLADVAEEFSFRIEEWEYDDGSHATETGSFAAFDAGTSTLDGGGLVEAGTVRTDGSFASASFDASFDSTPVVLAQSQTFAGSQPIVSRQQNVSAAGTEIRIQEEEAADGVHPDERVGYLALEVGTDSLGGQPLEADRIGGMTDQWERIEFDRTYSSPQFLADMQTFDGPDASGLRYRNLTATGVEVKVEEGQSADTETDHTSEVVGYLVVEGNPYTPADAEFVRVSSTQPVDDWDSIALSKSYRDPVVLMKPLSYEGNNPAHVRLADVGDEFLSRIEEWEYLDGSHDREETSYAAFESGARTLTGETPIEVGTVQTDETFTSVSFDAAFDSAPVVLTQPQTYGGSQPIVSRQRNVSTGATEIRIQEEEANGAHVTEQVGYVALEPGTDSLAGNEIEVGRAAGVTDDWTQIQFERPHDNPRFLADIQTFDGADASGLRYRNLTATGVEVKVEEERSADTEVGHTSEVVGYLVAEGN